MSRKLACVLAVVAAFGPLGVAGARAKDAEPDPSNFRWIPPRYDAAGGIVLLPKLYYSSENDLGFGLQAARPFRFPGTASHAPDSEFLLKGRYTTNHHSMISARSTVVFGDGHWLLHARLTHDTLALRFWGIGADTPAADEEIYRPQSTQAYVEVSRTVFGRLRLGVRAELQHHKYIETESGGLLDTTNYPGIGLDSIKGGGLIGEWDSRDDRYDPHRGLYLQGFAMAFGEDTGSDFSFNNYHADLRAYFPVGGKEVLALQGFFYSALGDAPIWRYAALGGRAHSRGYRKGRYLDRLFIAFQGELRRPIWWRLSGVMFAGLANVAEEYQYFQLETMRPTLGAGLRWQVSEDNPLRVRADLAFGEDSVRAQLSFGHAF